MYARRLFIQQIVAIFDVIVSGDKKKALTLQSI